MQIVMPIFALTLPEDAGEGALAVPQGRPEGRGSFLSVMAEGAAWPSVPTTLGSGDGCLAADLPAMGMMLPLTHDLTVRAPSTSTVGSATPSMMQNIVIKGENRLPILPLSNDIQLDIAGGISGIAKSAPVVAEGAVSAEDKGTSESPHIVLVDHPLLATDSLPPAEPNSGHTGQGEPWRAEGLIAVDIEKPETESDSQKNMSFSKTTTMSSATVVSPNDATSAWVTVPSREDTVAPSEPAPPQATSAPVWREALMPDQATAPSAPGAPREIPISTPAPQIPQSAMGIVQPQAPGHWRGRPTPDTPMDKAPEPIPTPAVPTPSDSTIRAPLRLAPAEPEQTVTPSGMASLPEASTLATVWHYG